MHYYAAGYCYAAKNRGMAMPSSDADIGQRRWRSLPRAAVSKLPQSKSWGGPTRKARASHRRPVFIADVSTTTDRGASCTDLYLRAHGRTLQFCADPTALIGIGARDRGKAFGFACAATSGTG